GKRIDLVVEGGQARLAVECDGDHWHGADQYEDDMLRQKQLERCGWEFFRVRESAFYANRKEALARLWPVLEERRIYPSANHPLEDMYGADVTRASNKVGTPGSDVTQPERLAPDERGNDAFSLTPPSTGVATSAVEGVTTQEIKAAIIKVLKGRPNHSCTLESLTRRILSHLEIRTRGKPRSKFDVRVRRQVVQLDRDGLVEKYK